MVATVPVRWHHPVMMRIALWIVLSMGLASGCDSKVVGKLEAFADKACACSDAACAQAVEAEYMKWWEGNKGAKGSEKHLKAAQSAAKKMAECLSRYPSPVREDMGVEVEASEEGAAEVEESPENAPEAPPKTESNKPQAEDIPAAGDPQ